MTMIIVYIALLGFTLFPGQPHWHELDTLGVEWSLVDSDVWDVDNSNSDYLRSGYQYGGDDGDDDGYACREADEGCVEFLETAAVRE